MYWRRRLTRLEAAIYAALAAILLAAVADRLLYVMELAERTAMETTIIRVNAALNTRLAYELILGKQPDVNAWLQRNPFELADAWPSNFLGGADTSNFKEMFRCRVLVPYVARPFYWFAQRYLPSLDAGFFGLLIANALFCATTACLIVSIGTRVLDDAGTALFGAALYLLSFNIPNMQLAGLIDSGEACFLAAVTWSLLNDRWYLLPLWGLLGALAKETFVPFSSLFVFTWWLTERSHGRIQTSRLKWIVALGVVGLATVMWVHSSVSGQFKWPWQIAHDLWRRWQP